MKKALPILTLLLLSALFCLQAQTHHYVKRKLYINNPGFVYISNGDTLHIEGNMTTVRHATATGRGMLSFAESSGWVSSNGSFVNGYVRSHKTDFFVFPVGQGVYRPAAISNAADAAPTDAAYYNTAQYSATALGAGVLAVSNESWIIQGTTPAVITLSWSSDISSFAATFGELCVAGWDASLTKWVEISSAVDVTSPVFGTVSNLATKGSISTASAIVPNGYAAYTLAKKCAQQITISNIVTITEPTCTTKGSIQFEISGGSGNYEYSVNGAPFAPFTDGLVSGLDAGYLTIDAKDVTYSCATAQADFTVPSTSQDFGISVTTTDADDCTAPTGKIQVAVSGTGSTFTFTLNGSASQPLPVSGIIENLPVGNYVVKVSNETGCSDSRMAVISCSGGSGGTPSKNIYVAGKVFIDTKGFVYIPTEATVHIEGNMTTVRNMAAAQRGMLSFAGTAGWISSNSSFVNGYVRSHEPGAFIFPVGQTTYRPAAISNATDAAPTDAAYYNTAQYSATALGAGVLAVSNESWMIQGTTPAVITLSWSSDISSFAATFDELCVAGWDASLTKWVEIPSTVDVTSPVFGTVSNLATKGSISTASAIVPNSYAAYTLGVRGCPRITIANIMTIVEPTCTRAGSIQFEITGGSGNYAYSINDEPFEPYTGAAVPVPSAGYLTLAAIDGSNPCDTARYDYTVPNTSQEFGISVVTEDATDCSSETGNIIITITGGEEPYTFTLNDGTPEPLPADSVIRNLAAGDYVVKVTDGNDCSDTQFAKITSTTSTIAITNFAVTADAICEVASGAITFTVSGCNYATYTYRVDAMSIVTASGGVHVVNNLSAGAHMLYVSDSCGTAALPFEIEKQSNGVLLSTTPKNIVQQCDDIVEFGYIALLASGGSGSYQYSVNGGVWHPFAYSDKDSVKNMTQGNYHIEIKDDMGCTDAADVAIVTVTLFPRPSAPSILTDTLSAFRWMPVDLSLAVDIIPGLTYNYYENADGTGKITGTVVVFNPPKNDYYVSASNGACESGLSQIILKDPCPATIDDGEGNTYKVTSLAGFCWTENLKATEYADGEPIPFANVYTCPTCPAQLDTIFGLLYDWNSATGGDICPIGWHVPSQAEWSALNLYDAAKLKSTRYWLNSGVGTDDYGFDARPAGWYNSALNRYQYLYGYAGWWASDDNGVTASSFYLSYYCDKIQKEIRTKADGLSVRCVMD